MLLSPPLDLEAAPMLTVMQVQEIESGGGCLADWAGQPASGDSPWVSAGLLEENAHVSTHIKLSFGFFLGSSLRIEEVPRYCTMHLVSFQSKNLFIDKTHVLASVYKHCPSIKTCI